MPTNPEQPEQHRRLIPAAGGAVCRRVDGRVQVLLIYRRGVWDLPKGKLDTGEPPESGALREVTEETGCRDLRITGPLGTTLHHYEEDGEQVAKRTWWYAMESGQPDLRPQLEEEIEALEWTDLSGALEKVAFDNLRTVLERLQSALNPG